MRFISLLLSITLLFSGCGGFYDSLDALQNEKSKDALIYTYNKDFKTVDTKVENFLMQCYNREKPILYLGIMNIPVIPFEGISTFCRKKI